MITIAGGIFLGVLALLALPFVVRLIWVTGKGVLMFAAFPVVLCLNAWAALAPRHWGRYGRACGLAFRRVSR